MHDLEIHLAMQNYSYITEVKDANVVANYFKKLLRKMPDPLCPFNVYEMFLTLRSVD